MVQCFQDIGTNGLKGLDAFHATQKPEIFEISLYGTPNYDVLILVKSYEAILALNDMGKPMWCNSRDVEKNEYIKEKAKNLTIEQVVFEQQHLDSLKRRDTVKKVKQSIKNRMNRLSRKKTCLWLKNLPPLMHTRTVKKPDLTCSKAGSWYNQGGKNRGKERARFWQGIAEAMAEQWIESADAI